MVNKDVYISTITITAWVLEAAGAVGRASELWSRGRWFNSWPGTIAQSHWAVYSLLCASVTEWYNLVLA